MKSKLLAVLAALILSPLTAHATNEYPAPFVISKLKVADANNYHVRVYHDSANWHCANGPVSPAWSYINEADSGAKAKIAYLMAARRMGEPVTLVTEGVTTNGTTYCRIKAVEM